MVLKRYMSRKIKVKIKPGNKLSFPAECVHCSQPAVTNLEITRRKGRLTRLIQVPLCVDCAQEVARNSWAEERWLRLGRIITVAAAIVLFVASYFLLPSFLPVWLRLLFSAGLIVLVVVGLAGIFRQRREEAARPEKQAILNAAQMVDFSWRATTFEFKNEPFAERFQELNQSHLMEI